MGNRESPGRIRGFILITITAFIIFSLGFFPILIGIHYVNLIIPFDELWYYFLIPFLLYIGITVTVFYEVLFSGLFIHIFNIKYEPGVHKYTYQNKMAFKWLLLCALYTPIRKILEIVQLGETKNRYYRFLGMKIGENSLIGGTIMDPCLTEVGDNCTIGLYAVIYGHIHDYEKEILILDKIKIGNNCIIGAGALIMPGAIIEDDVKLAAGAVVTKGQILKKGKTYVGIPAKEIKPKRQSKF